MKFMLFIYPDRSVELGADEKAAVPAGAWVSEMDARGVRLQGHVLAPVGEAKTLRVRGGEVEIDDGPVAESDAPISGFNILDCADLDEALEAASKHPVAKFGTLELRAFVES
jgi:hypothetical protein